MKLWQAVLIFLMMSALIFLAIIGISNSKTVNNLDNKWTFKAVDGAEGYEVWIITPADNNFRLLLRNVPHSPDENNMITFQHKSKEDESYQLRVRAFVLNADARTYGIWSFISDELIIDTSLSVSRPIWSE